MGIGLVKAYGREMTGLACSDSSLDEGPSGKDYVKKR